MNSVYSNWKTSSFKLFLWHTPITKWSVRYNCLYIVGLCNDKCVNVFHTSLDPHSFCLNLWEAKCHQSSKACVFTLSNSLWTCDQLSIAFWLAGYCIFHVIITFTHWHFSKIKVNGDYWELSMLGFCLTRGPFYSYWEFIASDFTASTMKLSSLHSVSCL